MNSLDELFGDALEREALATTHEHRSGIADVTVHTARHNRRVRGTVQGLVAAAVVGIAAVVAPMLIGDDTATPANPTPTPTQPAPSDSAEPNLEYASIVDDRFPQAPAMDASDWAAVTSAWDAEYATFIAGGGDNYGSSAAIFLTPPDGERMLAWATRDTTLSFGDLLAFDPEKATALIFEQGTSSIMSVDLVTGAVTDLHLAIQGPIVVAAPLGRASDGDSLFVVYTSDGNDTGFVFRSDGGEYAAVYTGAFMASPVWADAFVTSEDVLYVVNADGDAGREFAELRSCFFHAWNTDGTFAAFCYAEGVEEEQYVVVNPETGASTPIEALPELTAVDRHRERLIAGGDSSMSAPPVIYEDGVEVADLSEGFTQSPDGYRIIFGARGDA